MRQFFKPLLMMTLVLLVPVVPFVALGDPLEARIKAWFGDAPSKHVLAVAVAGVLATDILLPVPSSFVSTLGGSALGVGWGTLASWVGMTAGAVLGYLLARWLGRPLALRMAGEEELARMERLGDRYGPLILVLARGVPVMAEASVLLFGATRLSLNRFLLPVATANLGIAWAYSHFGKLAADHMLLPIALGVSIALPVVITGLFHRFLPADTAE